MAAKHATTQMLAHHLIAGYWDSKGENSHHFESHTISVNLNGLTKVGQVLARKALAAWEAVADIKFNEEGSGAKLVIDDNETGANTDVWYRGQETEKAHVNIGVERLDGGAQVGDFVFRTYIHEIGHALGLGHPTVYTTGTVADALFRNDSWQQTVMSYLNQDENPFVDASLATPVTPMMADILAIQQIYGRATGGPTAGTTCYGVGADTGTYIDATFKNSAGSLSQDAMTIYDASGVDTINFSDDAKAQVVKLAGGCFSSVYGLKGNLGIAYNTVIENYVAGRGDDKVTGNAAGNRITLGEGSDHADGQKGKDVIQGDGGADRLRGGEGADRLLGNFGIDKLWGDKGNDVLLGGAQGDLLQGGLGNDTLNGGDGNDRFVFNSGHDAVTDFQDDEDTLVLNSSLWGGKKLTLHEVLDFADLTKGGGIRFDFGNHTLRIDDMTNIEALRDDLHIV